MKKLVFLVLIIITVNGFCFGQATFFYAKGVEVPFPESSYKASTLEDVLLSYTNEKYKILVSIMILPLDEDAEMNFVYVCHPFTEISERNLFSTCMLFQSNANFIEVIKKIYGDDLERFMPESGLKVVLYVRRNNEGLKILTPIEGEEYWSNMNFEFVIDAMRFSVY